MRVRPRAWREPLTARELWLARHPAVDAAGLCYGRTDVRILGTVVEASADLARSLEDPCPVVWSSPSSRCADVAAALASRWRSERRIDARLLEMDFGDWEGRAWSSIEREDPTEYAAWMDGWKVRAPPKGERLDALTERVDSWLRDLSAVASPDVGRAPVRHACIAHAGVIRALLVLREGLSWEDAMGREIPHLAWRQLSI